jgi:hypothetical protein
MLRVKTENLGPLINQLEKFDKGVAKDLKKELSSASDLVVKAARSSVDGVPVSNWGKWIESSKGRDLSYDPGAVRKGYRRITNRYRRGGATISFGQDVSQMDPAGAVFEFVGTKSSTDFARFLNKRFGPVPAGGKMPRRLGPAYYSAMGEARQQVEAAIRKAQARVGQ